MSMPECMLMCMHMSALQVRNVPEELHAALRERAEAEGVSVGEIVLRALRRELRRETFREWADRVANLPLERRPSREEVRAVLDEVRAERRWDD